MTLVAPAIDQSVDGDHRKLPTRQSLAETNGSSVWEYVSASRLNLWLRCPLAFKFRYIEGVRTRPTPSMFLGQRVHHALEMYYRHRQFGVAVSSRECEEYLMREWDVASDEGNVRFQSHAQSAEQRDKAVALVRHYIETLPDDEPRPLAVETRLEAPLIDPLTGQDFGIPLVGIIDLVLPNPNGPRVIDFKTAARGGTPSQLLHEIQLTAYAYLIRQLSGQAESCLEIRRLLKTRQPKVDAHRYEPRSDEHLRRFFAIVREYLSSLKQNRFNYRPHWSCSTCELRSRCDQWNGE